MKKITIDGQEYTITFSIEATMYNECTESIMDMIISSSMIQDSVANETDLEKKQKNIVDAFKTSVSDIPRKTLTLFYAGLLEYHGSEGDKRVMGISDAKKLLVAYIQENDISMFEVMNEMVEQMGEDHFFDMIGVDKMIEEPKKTKTPQDHKRKSKNGEN